MTDNHYKKYERRIRHIMCIFLALETLLFCLLVIMIYFDLADDYTGGENGNNALQLLHYHVIDLKMILPNEFWKLCIGTIVCTVLSIRFKWFYRTYEGLHILLGIYNFFGTIAYSLFSGSIYLLLLSIRLAIYTLLISKYLKQHNLN